MASCRNDLQHRYFDVLLLERFERDVRLPSEKVAPWRPDSPESQIPGVFGG